MLMSSQPATIPSSHSRNDVQNKLLIFDLSLGGHHPGYIQHLIRYWGEQELPGTLDVLVVEKFIQQHYEVVETAQTYGRDRVNFVTLTSEEESALADRSTFLQRRFRSLREWEILARYTHQLQSTDCLLMYFDTCQLPLGLRQRLACPFSGIYFRPTFHYSHFAESTLTRKEQGQQLWERLYLPHVLHHPQLKTLFCLDPFAVDPLKQFNSRVNFIHLPDPVQTYDEVVQPAEHFKGQLGIEPDRQVFLLFGALNERKGIHPLLEAVQQLPPELAHKLCLLLVGPISGNIRDRVYSQIEQIRSRLPVQIIVRDQFFTDQAIEPFFQITDVVLAPYQRHVGMSAILARAATAQKPVLCSDYGLMGEITRRYQLGTTVDSTQPGAIARGLQHCLQHPSELGNRTKMQEFARQNTAEQFAAVIFQNLYFQNSSQVADSNLTAQL